MIMNNQAKAYLYAGIAIFFWSTVASAFKIALRQLDFLELVFYASVVSLLFLGVVLISQGKMKRILHFSLAEYGRSAILGFLNPFLYYIVLLKAYSLLPAQVAQPLNMIWPIILVFLSVPLLKQTIPARSFMALFICFAGVYLISSQGNVWNIEKSDPLGVALATGSSLIWSLYWIFNVRDRREEIVKLFLNFFFATFFLLALNLALGKFRSVSFTALLPAVYVGLFEMGVSFFFWMRAMQLARSTDTISTLVYLAPFLSLVFIHLLVGEHIYVTTVVGLILIVMGIVYQKFRLGKKKRIFVKNSEP
ncbi:MAG: DMT family transporter [Bacteroidales bacterium]